MRIGGRWGARPAVALVRQGALCVVRSPVFGIAMIAPLVFAGAVGAAAPASRAKIPRVQAAVTPVAAVAPTPVVDLSGPAVIAVERPPTSFHFAETTGSAPPPAMVVNSPGALGIPVMALTAYRNAEQKMAVAAPGCGISWNLLAGIGRIESMHANGGAVDERGTAVSPIYGPALDGTLPGNEIIIQSKVGNRVTYARAMGPMQFLPGTWARYAVDGDNDGVPDPQNIFDSTLAAARYLCSGGLNLRDPAQVMAAILRYNNSMPYAQNVLGWAAAYATGVLPVDLPPITGPPPPIGDAHLEQSEGLGPNLPLNANGLGINDPAGHMPLINFGPPPVPVAPPPMFPWLQPTPQPQAPQPGCTLICITPQSPPEPPPVGGPMPFGIMPPPPPPAPPAAPPADPLAPLGGPAPANPAPAPPNPAPGASAPANPAPKPAGPPPAPTPNPPAPGGPVLTPIS
ncbi:lytic murein transglycosylase B [Mycobacterium basiliense]|uniref:Lytic murein transglycosylase B n=1 Tax=Mycobacterium basiliense TaxID=2094119 RepID=A0A3S4DVD5_9MYCO|nr:lytic transglycosylase domain-containing protein [Mycobacterium basiliense]VDM90079.1 lytic murein transglycosylase B [Mycobacterium basiliense]